MFKTLILSLFILTGCSGIFDDLQITAIVPPSAAQEFEANGGNTLHFIDSEVSQLEAVEVIATRDINGNPQFPLSCGNYMIWNVQGLDPVNFNYWLSKEIVVTYSPSKFLCGQTWRCDVPRDIANNPLEGSIELIPDFGAIINVICTLQ